jgi:hypothetical protein
MNKKIIVLMASFALLSMGCVYTEKAPNPTSIPTPIPKFLFEKTINSTFTTYLYTYNDTFSYTLPCQTQYFCYVDEKRNPISSFISTPDFYNCMEYKERKDNEDENSRTILDVFFYEDEKKFLYKCDVEAKKYNP